MDFRIHSRSFAFIPAIFVLAGAANAQSNEPLKLGKLALSVGPGRGSAVIGWKITSLNRSARAGIQLFLQRTDATGRTQWDTVAPETNDGPVILNLEKGRECSGTFNIPLEKGAYGGCRLMLFLSTDGKSVDYGNTIFDSANDPSTAGIRFGFVSTGEKRTLVPTLSVSSEPEVTTTSTDSYTVSISGEVRMPSDLVGSGYSAVAQSESGIRRVRISLADALPAEPGSDERRIPVHWVYEGVKPGLWSVQAGLARTGGDVRWTQGRIDFEIGDGSWMIPVAGALPPRLRVRRCKFETADGASSDLYADQHGAQSGVNFIRGGNFGNAICWTATPALNRADYFRQLREMGLRFIRVNYSADRYLEQPYYPRTLEQVVRNIWSAGLYPLLAPQDLPKGASDSERITKLTRLLEQVAAQFKGKPVWLEVLNEPYAFPTWSKWKPAAVRLVRAIRAVDADAFCVVPFESWAKDGRAAAADPITEVRVDLYDGHAYLKPEEVSDHFASAIRAGLPVMLGEFGGGASYLREMVQSIQKLPRGLVAVAPWAFTMPGQDAIPLIEQATEKDITFTQSGKVIADAYRTWNTGRKVAN